VVVAEAEEEATVVVVVVVNRATPTTRTITISPTTPVGTAVVGMATRDSRGEEVEGPAGEEQGTTAVEEAGTDIGIEPEGTSRTAIEASTAAAVVPTTIPGADDCHAHTTPYLPPPIT